MTITEAVLPAVLGAAITSAVAFIGLIIGKENKISEFRQAWIDALRADLASLIANVNEIHALLSSGRGMPDTAKSYAEAHRAIVSVRLRVNASEAPSEAVLNLLDRLDKEFAQGNIPDGSTLDKIDKELMLAARALFKTEWERVKNGEPIYRATKHASFVVLIFSIEGAVAWFVCH